MKKSIIVSMFAAAALCQSGAFASEREVVRVDVPFSFQIPGVKLAAGQYELRSSEPTGATRVWLRNSETGAQVTALALVSAPKESNDITPKFVYRCAGDDCWLAEVRNLSGGRTLSFPHPKHISPAAAERAATIYVKAGAAD